MNAAEIIETLSNWIVITSGATLLSVILASWLMTYRTPKVAPVVSRDWFFVLPTWAQIVGGLGACVLFALLGFLFWIPLPLTILPSVGMTLRLVGLVVFVAGWVLVLWARWAIGPMYGVSTSFTAPLQTKHCLIQRGPYAFIRHPMYLGYWLVLAGVALIYLTWTALLLLAICLASFYRRARREEAALAERFGAEWQTYASRTRFLIPFVY